MAKARSSIDVALVVLLFTTTVHGDTGTALGDRSGEGSTPFTGLAQAPEANLFTGALGTAIPIEVPPGRRSMTPRLALQYSSSAGPSPFGYGWNLPIGRIERSTSWGVPRCSGPHSDDFVLALPSGAAELVREAPGSSFYRPKVEQAWVRAEKLQSQNQWVVYDRSGLKYTFGLDDSARVSNVSPSVFLAQAPDGTCQLTTEWALSQIEDPNGNLIDVSWSKILNVLYPATVRWGGNSQNGGPAHLYTVRFLPEYRPPLDRQVSSHTGVAARMIWRIYQIDVETDVPVPGTAVRSYALQYRDDAPGAVPEGYQSILSAVTVSGRPTQHFAYTPSVTGHQATTTTLAKPAAAYGELRVANSSLEVSQSVLDMNGDGVLDLVRSDDPSPSSWLVFWGAVTAGGFGFQSTGTAWQVPGNWQYLRNVATAGGGCLAGWACTRTDTFDLTGDGIPDYIDASNGSTWTVYPGRGVPQWGFAPGISWPANRQHIRRSFEGDTYQDVVDVTGDGLPDLVISGAPGQAPPYQWDVYANTGAGFDPVRLPAWPAPVNVLLDHVAGGIGHELMDFNGDGLPDLVRTGNSGFGGGTDPRCAPSIYALTSCLEVYLNTGQGFAGLDPLIPVPLSWTVQQTESDYSVVQDLVDINGDGLPDWIYRRYNYQAHAYENQWRVLLNLGGNLEEVVYDSNGPLGPPYSEAVAARVWMGAQGPLRQTVDANTRTDLIDVNGDGFLDQVTAGGSSWTVRLHAAVEKPNLLGLMENGLGGTNTVVYRPSTAYVNTGGDAQPDLPFITWVVDKTRQNDAQCTPPPGADVFTAGTAPNANPCIDSGNELVTRYAYQDGRYDPIEREFRGFRRVVRTSVEGSAETGNQTATFFGQTNTIAGRILQVDTYAGSANLVRSEMNSWGTRSAGTGRTQIWLSQNVRATYDLTTSGAPQFAVAGSDPPDDYGNDTHHYTAGLFDADHVDTYTTYASPQSSSRVYDRPATVRIAGAGGVTLQEQWFYYDGSGANGMGSGSVSKGNLKRLRSRLTASVANGPEIKMAYDAYGNLIQATDANGKLTTTTYEPRLLYPQTVTNPLGHQTTTDIDYRWGQPTAVHDANGATTYFGYDAAGRHTCVARPPDTLSNCTQSTTYQLATAPGVLSWVQTDERQDGPHPPLTTRHYFDALGRPRYSDRYQVVDGVPGWVRSNQTVYDPGGRVRVLLHPYRVAAGAPNNGSTTYDYHLNGSPFIDPLGRLYRTTNSDLTNTRTEYAGALTTAIDEAGQRSETVTDALGRVTSQRVYDGTALYATTDRTYDGLGHLLQLRQNGVLIESLTYDCMGRKTQMVDQNSGTWRYGYDGVGNLLWQDDPLPNRHVEFCYDAINRPTRRCPIATDYQQSFSCSLACGDPETVLLTYDAASVPNARGRLTSVVDASGSTDVLEYDARGRQRRVTTTVDSGDRSGHATFAYGYDSNDRVISIGYPDGEIVLVDYDDGGQPIVLRNSGNTFYVVDARYDLFGRPTLIQHVNGVSDTHTYGGPMARHRLQALAADKSGSKLLDLTYDQYSARGLLERMTDRRSILGELSNTAVFSYDALGRLTGFDSVHNPWDRQFAYDAMGNMTRNGDRFLTYGNPSKPHQVTRVNVGSPGGPAQTVTHDAAGNRTSKQTQSYQYDTTGRLAEVDVGSAAVDFLYDCRGRQAAKIVAGSPPTVTHYYGELAETTNGYLTKSYYLGGIRVASQSTSYVAWETAALGTGSVYLAGASLDQPALVVVLAREAQWMVAAVLLCIATGLLALPWRRRPVVGIRVRPGHAILIALVCAVGTLPWPLIVQPPAHAGGYGGSILRHYHLDHLGSTQVITDASGNIIEQIRYLPYGQVRGHWSGTNQLLSTPATGNRREFTGYESDLVSGLEYAGARYYDPELGLFLTHDPATQFASPYSYGGGDPVNWTDPSGSDFLVGFIIALAIGALASAAINAIIAAAQGLPGSAIGKAAIGGAIAGAVGVGLGVVASAAAMGAASVAATLPANVSFGQALDALGEVAFRSAFSTTVANAAGQTAAAAGAPRGAVTATSFVSGLFGSLAYDELFQNPHPATSVSADRPKASSVSTTGTHTEITVQSMARTGIEDHAAEILDANLARDRGWWNVLNNQDHFDSLTKSTSDKLQQIAFESSGSEDAFISATGGALHHLQDQYALGHILPGTHAFGGPWGAPFRFIIHNLIGGEVTFQRASEQASVRFLGALQSATSL